MFKVSVFIGAFYVLSAFAQHSTVIDSSDYNLLCYHPEKRYISAFGNVSGIIQHGKWVLFNEEGNVKAKGRYRKGRRQGKWQFYDEAGGLMEEGRYKRGLKVGTWQVFEKYYVIYNKGKVVEQNAFK